MPAGNPMAYGAYRKAKGGKDMSYEDYMKACKAEGMAAMGAEDYSKAEQDYLSAQPGGGLGKSETIDSDALIKAIDDYETMEEALTQAGGSRESILTAKMKDGTITKSEQQELGRIWSGDQSGGEAEPLSKSLLQRIEEDDAEAAKLIDASDLLKSLVGQTNEALDDMGRTIEREGLNTRNLLGAQGQLLKSTAHVLAQQSTLIKSQQVVISEMGRRLGVLEGEPVVRKSQGSDPRDVRPRDATQRGAGGRGEGEDTLTKSQVQQGLSSLVKKADAAGDEQAIDRLVTATALYESTGRIHPNIAGAIRMELGQ